jgi:hypothetical protein
MLIPSVTSTVSSGSGSNCNRQSRPIPNSLGHNLQHQAYGYGYGYVPPTVTYSYSEDPYSSAPRAGPRPIPRLQAQPQPAPVDNRQFIPPTPDYPLQPPGQIRTNYYQFGLQAPIAYNEQQAVVARIQAQAHINHIEARATDPWSTQPYYQFRYGQNPYTPEHPRPAPYEPSRQHVPLDSSPSSELSESQLAEVNACFYPEFNWERPPVNRNVSLDQDPPPPYTPNPNDTDPETMSRASSRPTHIAMPTANGATTNGGRSPNGSPLPTPHGATSPTSPRSSFLPNFIRTRSRAGTLTGGRGGRQSPTVEASNPLGGGRPVMSRNPSNTGETTHVTRSVSTPQGMAQAANSNQTTTADSNPKPPVVSLEVKAKINAAQPPRETPITTYRIRLVPHLESTRSLAFDPVTREMLPIICPSGITPTTVAHNLDNVPNALNGRPPALILKVGRFTEKTTTAPPTATTGAGPSTDAIGQGPMSAVIVNSGGGGDICSSRVAFKSKVVSRSHAEIWCEPNGKVGPF